jgi:hypothetical protein
LVVTAAEQRAADERAERRIKAVQAGIDRHAESEQ